MLWATSAICWKASGIWIRYAPIRSASPLMGRRWTVNTCSVPCANSTSIAGMMKLEREEVILDDGLFELLLVPHPQNAAELQNLIWALLNQQYNSGGLHFPPCVGPSCGNGRESALVPGRRVRTQSADGGHH